MGKVRARKETGKLYMDFQFRGTRCREQTALKDTQANRRLLEQTLNRIEAEITVGTFDYAATFPGSKRANNFVKEVPTDAHGMSIAHRAPATPHFGNFSDEWFDERSATWKRSYQKKVTDIIETHLKPAFENRHVCSISKADILKYRAALAGKTEGSKVLSGSRINQIMNMLKQIMDEAAERFEFPTPYRAIKPMRTARSQIDPFSLDEIQKFLNAVDDEWRNYFSVRFFTGMRTSEIDGLKWKYVDFDRREILVRETLVKGEMDVPKTAGSEREIQMSTRTFQALQAQWNKTGSDDGFVFCGSRGKPIHYRNMNNRIWYPTLKRCGLKLRNPYQTRHTAATLWLAAGESPEWIARQMGHTNTKMLFTVYSRYVPNLTRKDGSAFDNLLNTLQF